MNQADWNWKSQFAWIAKWQSSQSPIFHIVGCIERYFDLQLFWKKRFDRKLFDINMTAAIRGDSKKS